MANEEITDNKNEIKFAPIFTIKSRDNVMNNNKTNNNLKRKKKSKKSENNNKVNKKIDKIEDISEPIDCRRSLRLRNKVEEKVLDIIEDNDENTENYFIENQTNETNDEMVKVCEENSNTIDYWNEINSIQKLNQSEDNDDIEVVYSQTSNNGSQESRVDLPSIKMTEEYKPCLLWTEKYKPRNSSEIIGHKKDIKRLKTWLEDWNKNNNRVEKKDNTSEDDSCDDSDHSNACLLICGPTGSGKTSMVYAIAEELKYEVLELNSSMKRNGRIVSKIVCEATQSHQMQRSQDIRPNSIQSFFTVKSDDEVKVEKVVKNKTKNKNKGILNYFKKQKTENSNENQIQVIVEKDNDLAIAKTEMNSSNNNSINCSKALSLTSNSLILFDDVDVIFEEDFNSFWTAVNKINSITKKPVILTATQFVDRIKDCVNNLQVLTLGIPDYNNTVMGLKNICDKEVDDEESEVSVDVYRHLTNSYNYDIRRCINELQFSWDYWTKSDIKLDKELIEDNEDINKCYESLIFSDLISTKFNVLNESENRELYMNSKPILIEDDNHSICLAKDIINTFDDLSEKIYGKYYLNHVSNQKLPIESNSIDSISKYFPKNLSLQTLITDYFPYLSFMCESESIRQSQIATHSRKSRRFMHHLDSNGVYISHGIRHQLISGFIKEKTEIDAKDDDIENDKTINSTDDDFYD